MRKALIAIGVGNTDGGFAKLKGAAKDARAFHAWGTAQGFDCTLLVDDRRKKIRVADVYEAIDGYVRQRIYSQIIVYFSGHGILKAPECELWLMSGAPRNGNEVINVQGSIFNARTCGIEHVVFISDACRSLPAELKDAVLSSGQHVFPFIAWRPPVPEVDVFYATLPGDVALEVPPDAALARDRGLLTECLLAALEGKVPQVITSSVDVDGVEGQTVPSRPLKAWLTSELPLAASNISFKLQQHPDIRVESDVTKYLAKLKGSPAPSRLVPSSVAAAPTWSSAHGMHQSAGRVRRLVAPRQSVRGPRPRLGQSLPTEKSTLGHNLYTYSQSDDIARVLHATNPAQYVRTGFVSQGRLIEHAVGEQGALKVSSDSHHSWIELDDAGNATGSDCDNITGRVALRFRNGRGIVLAVFPGYVGTVISDSDQVVTVNYTPSFGSANFQEFTSCAGEIEERHKQVALASQRGTFSIDSTTFNDAAAFVRADAAAYPTLSIYLSYAYARAGKFAAVNEVSALMSRRGQSVPFDVAMLAAQGSRTFPTELPGMPMLTQGWLMLGAHETTLPEALKQARQFLVPSLWATFSPDGMSILEQYIQKKD